MKTRKRKIKRRHPIFSAIICGNHRNNISRDLTSVYIITEFLLTGLRRFRYYGQKPHLPNKLELYGSICMTYYQSTFRTTFTTYFYLIAIIYKLRCQISFIKDSASYIHTDNIFLLSSIMTLRSKKFSD